MAFEPSYNLLDKDTHNTLVEALKSGGIGYTEADGTVHKISGDYVEGGGGGGSDLPEVTADDNGDVLTVVSGAWAKAAPSGGTLMGMVAEPPVFYTNAKQGEYTPNPQGESIYIAEWFGITDIPQELGYVALVNAFSMTIGNDTANFPLFFFGYLFTPNASIYSSDNKYGIELVMPVDAGTSYGIRITADTAFVSGDPVAVNLPSVGFSNATMDFTNFLALINQFPI